MANRKVLINRHTSGSSAPQADSMYLGEIAVAHETGKETLFTKNNAGDMVPFISCAQTIAMIESMVQASEDSVVAKAGEAHIEVESAGTADATIWQISSKDVQSEEEFEAFSAETKTRIDNNYSAVTAVTDAFYDLLNIVLTGISGDTIIVAETSNPNDSANTVSLTHRLGHEASGFNKLDTDAYGHVTAHTAVATADIQALGFKTSAETGEDLEALSASVVANETHIGELSAGTIADIEALSGDVISYVNNLSAGTLQLSADTHNAIAAAIEALDSSISASSAGKYFTALAIEDGKLVAKEEASIPVLEVESAGTGNVVASIAVDGHKITYQTASVATSEGIAELSAATIALSAGTIHDIETLSGDVVEYVKVVSGNIETVINELSAGTEAGLNALSAGTIHDNEVLSADVITYINTISGYAHGEIVELSGAVQANETDIDNLSAATLDLSAVTLTGVSLNNTPLEVNNHVASVPVAVDANGIANAGDSGTVADAKAVKEYVQSIVSSAVNYKGATSSEPSNPTVGDLWVADTEFDLSNGKHVEVGDFIIYGGEEGYETWDVIEKNLDGAVTGTLTVDTVTLGDGSHAVRSLANGSNGEVLTMVNGTPAWADDPVLSVVSAGTGNVLTDITVSDHEITFTKGVTAAADADLQTLSGATEAISGYAATQISELSAGTIAISGFAHGEIAELSGAVEANEDAIEALSAGTIALVAASAASVFASAKTYTDEQIDEVYASGISYTDEKVAAEIALLDSVGSASTTGHYLTSVTITDGKISAIGEEAVPAATPVTTVNGTTGDTAAAVLTDITTGGTEGHQLTLNSTNKIFSASTADEAVKVKSALTVNFATDTGSTAYTFDGSDNVTVNISDSATTETGHYTPSTADSTEVAPAGTFISAITLDSKKHVIGVGTADKVNSATTSESADTAARVANALSISGYSDSSVASLDTAISYDGSAAQALTFGTVGDSGFSSMSMNSNGVVDVEVIDCGTY